MKMTNCTWSDYFDYLDGDSKAYSRLNPNLLRMAYLNALGYNLKEPKEAAVDILGAVREDHLKRRMEIKKYLGISFPRFFQKCCRNQASTKRREEEYEDSLDQINDLAIEFHHHIEEALDKAKVYYTKYLNMVKNDYTPGLKPNKGKESTWTRGELQTLSLMLFCTDKYSNDELFKYFNHLQQTNIKKKVHDLTVKLKKYIQEECDLRTSEIFLYFVDQKAEIINGRLFLK